MAGADNTDREWFIAFTNPRSEEMLQAILKRRQFDTYLPAMTVTRRRADVKRPLFPRYVFVALRPEQRLFHLRQTPRLEGIVKVAGKPYQVAPEIVAGLIVAEGDGVYDFTAQREAERVRERAFAARAEKLSVLAPGLLIAIINGPFKRFSGQVDKVLPPDRVSVLVPCFGRRFPVPMMLDDVELAARPAR